MPSRKQAQADAVSEMGIPHLMISEETILEIKATVTVVREENERLRQRIADLEEKLIAAVKIIQEREDICNNANETIAMCKKRIADLEAALSRAQCAPDNRPRPDWSQAPDWAQWWAVWADGGARWYKIKPLKIASGWASTEYSDFCADIEIPLGIDWRTLIAKRQ